EPFQDRRGEISCPHFRLVQDCCSIVLLHPGQPLKRDGLQYARRALVSCPCYRPPVLFPGLLPDARAGVGAGPSRRHLLSLFRSSFSPSANTHKSTGAVATVLMHVTVASPHARSDILQHAQHTRSIIWRALHSGELSAPPSLEHKCLPVIPSSQYTSVR
ncbi:unnamed protein product, partial [Sphacelaria rigidula]